MTMNWLVDRLLFLGIVQLGVGALATPSAAGFSRVGEICGFVALVAAAVTV